MKRRVHRPALPVFTLVLSGFAVCPATAQIDPRTDFDTGRHTANFPPARNFDHRHMLLNIDIPDMDEPKFTARQTLTLVPIGTARTQLRLDAIAMDIHGIELDDRSLAYAYDGSELVIDLGQPAPVGDEIQVTIEYALEYPKSNGVGLTWSAGNPDADFLTDQSPQIHAQGQPQSNSRWFPCHDFPNERTNTELVVTADESYQVVSNGRLLYRSPSGDGRTTWHWLQDKPHPYYLVTLVIGRFAEIDVGGDGSARPGLPMTVYAPHGSEGIVAQTFGRTADMVAHFEELFAEPFAWDKYDQLLVRNFAAGAMENTSATTFAQSFSSTPRFATEPIIAHELVHQWFGDLVTCKAWHHLWLNEGWASYGEALWAEAAAPAGEGRAAYLDSIRGFLGRQSAFNHGFAPTYPAMASRHYDDPQHTFFKPDDVYAKGALVLHMLHERLGHKVFWTGVRGYLDLYRFKEAESDDFRRVLERASGENLERFFDQWVHRPGLPRLRVDADFDADLGTLYVVVEQLQTIDADNAPYEFTLPIQLEFSDGAREMVSVEVTGKSSGGTFIFPDAPVGIVVNPDLTVAATVRVSHTLGGN